MKIIIRELKLHNPRFLYIIWRWWVSMYYDSLVLSYAVRILASLCGFFLCLCLSCSGFFDLSPKSLQFLLDAFHFCSENSFSSYT